MIVPTAPDIATELGRRRAASWRLPPLGRGHRDPLDCAAAGPGPSTYFLTREELARHIARLGWHQWEVRARFEVEEDAA